MTEAEERLLETEPVGYRFFYIAAAIAKRFLLSKDVDPQDRLLVLEKMHRLVDNGFTEQMLATVEPAGDTEELIFKEAKSLKTQGEYLMPAYFDALTRDQTFFYFAALNPSILAAMKLRPGLAARGAESA